MHLSYGGKSDELLFLLRRSINVNKLLRLNHWERSDDNEENNSNFNDGHYGNYVVVSQCASHGRHRNKILFTYIGENIPENLREYLKEENIEVDNETKLEWICETRDSLSEDYLLVTNMDDNTIRRDTLLLIQDDGTSSYASLLNVNGSSYGDADYPWGESNAKYTVHATAYYDWVINVSGGWAVGQYIGFIITADGTTDYHTSTFNVND